LNSISFFRKISEFEFNFIFQENLRISIQFHFSEKSQNFNSISFFRKISEFQFNFIFQENLRISIQFHFSENFRISIQFHFSGKSQNFNSISFFKETSDSPLIIDSQDRKDRKIPRTLLFSVFDIYNFVRKYVSF